MRPGDFCGGVPAYDAADGPANVTHHGAHRVRVEVCYRREDIARSGVAPGIYRLEPADVTVDIDHRACTSLAHKTADVEG
jgi:hypothetical protein